MKQVSFQTLAQAVEAYYGELRQFIRQRTGSADLAEEVVQETWIRAQATTAALPDNPRAYLYRMAGNLAVDQLRRERAIARLIHSEPADKDDTQLAERSCTRPSPVETLICQQELAALETAVGELPDKCRAVFLLYRGKGLTMREVAEQLSISEKTVEKHIARAMVHCRKRLREAGRNV